MKEKYSTYYDIEKEGDQMISEKCEDTEIPLLRLIPLIYKVIDFNSQKKRYDLTKSQFIVLVALYSRGILNMTETSEFISSSKEQSTRAVAPLVEKGLVKRFELEDNRKRVYIELTESGKEFMQEFWKEMHKLVAEKLCTSLNEEELRTLFDSVKTAASLLSKVK